MDTAGEVEAITEGAEDTTVAWVVSATVIMAVSVGTVADATVDTVADTRAAWARSAADMRVECGLTGAEFTVAWIATGLEILETRGATAAVRRVAARLAGATMGAEESLETRDLIRCPA